MKSKLILALVLSLAVFLPLLAGCGGGADGERVIEDERRRITVDDPEEEGDSRKVTIEGEDGRQSTIEVQEQAPSEEALGAPIYVEADFVEGSGVSGKAASDEKEIAACGAEFTTGDETGKVIEWYVGKLGDPHITMPEEATWMYRHNDGSITMVTVGPYEDKTKITIARISGELDISL